MVFRRLLLAAFPLFAFVVSAGALGESQYVHFTFQPGDFALVADGTAATIVVAPGDYPGVVRVARDFQADVERVTGRKPALETQAPSRAPDAVIIGTVGHSTLIDRLVSAGKLNVGAIRGQWESWTRELVIDPLPGISRALVIAGSDKRGAIYGVYDVSEQIGVSPWYWWADVAPEHHDAVYVEASRFVQGPPSVKYRGIFLNDEAPDLTNWVRARFGNAPVSQDPPVPPGVANYGHAFYARIFEVLLRLRGNYLWPAMWANAFNEDDPENARLADEYGVVMGTSHQEPMLRAQKEWDRRFLKTLGTWNYATHPEVLETFWREGVRRNRAFESIITLGLRGANDTEMAPGGPEANRTLLEKIVDRQRQILREEISPDLARVPQLWCLYKEVQDFYEAGMRVPDDVTLLWAEDNWGNIRRLPTREERARRGGAGVYYHFDYHGGPRSYQWLNTSPLPKIWEQLSLAKQYGADRVWIVNVGHFKGYEVSTEFFLNFAWNTDRWNAGNLGEFLRAWATREFGAGHAADIADIVAKYTKYNGRRKPEQLAPTTYSLVNGREAESVVADFDAIAARAEALYQAMPPEKWDAFYQLVLFPTKASARVNQLYHAAGRNALYARQGRASANDMAAEAHRLFQADLDLMAYFNHGFAGGRWAHFMDQPHLGYTTWRDPPRNSLDAIPLVEAPVPEAASLGVAVEGSEPAWPGAATTATLPAFDGINRQRRYFEIFNRGHTSFEATVMPSAPWISCTVASASAVSPNRPPGDGAAATQTLTVGPDQRLWVSIDWKSVPEGTTAGCIKISGAGAEVVVALEVINTPALTRGAPGSFVENDGVVSIEPEHATRNTPHGAYHWTRIADYGRTLSGMRAEAPVDTPSAIPPANAPVLEYQIHVFKPGPVEVTAITSPTLNFAPDRGLRYAVAFDDQPPQTITLVPPGYRAQNGNKDWERVVSDNARYSTSQHVLAGAGTHTLKVWMVDPAVVLQKLIVSRGNLKPSYLGPPESLRIAR